MNSEFDIGALVTVFAREYRPQWSRTRKRWIFLYGADLPASR
jgi:hypothetical protein